MLQHNPNGNRERTKIKGVDNVSPSQEIQDLNAVAMEQSSHTTMEMEKETQRLQWQNRVLERELRSKGGEVSALQKELSRVQLEAATKIRAMEQHASGLQLQLDLMQSQRMQVEERVISMTRNMSRGKTVVEKLAGELMSKISAQEQMITSQRERFDLTAASCRNSRDKDLQEMNQRIKDLEATVKQQKAIIESQDTSNIEASAKLKQIECEKSAADEEIARLKESEVHQLLIIHKLKIAESVHSEMEEINKNKLHDLQMRCTKLQAELEATNKNMEGVRQRNTQLEMENQELTQGVINLGDGFRKLESSCIAQIEVLNSKISKCSKGNQFVKEGIEAVAYEKSDLEIQNHEMMIRVDSLSHGVDLLEMGFREQIENLDSRLSICTEANQFLRHGLELLTSKKKVLELENNELRTKVMHLNEGFRMLGETVEEQIDRLDSEIARCYEENRIIKQGLEAVTSKKHETELQNRQLLLGLVVLDGNLRRMELAFEERILFANYRMIECLRELQMAKGLVEAVASKERELEKEKQELMLEVEDLREKKGERTEEREEKIMELEKVVREMREDAAQKDEEKRQVIMQLCLQIEYHRDRYNAMVEKLSSTLW